MDLKALCLFVCLFVYMVSCNCEEASGEMYFGQAREVGRAAICAHFCHGPLTSGTTRDISILAV